MERAFAESCAGCNGPLPRAGRLETLGGACIGCAQRLCAACAARRNGPACIDCAYAIALNGYVRRAPE